MTVQTPICFPHVTREKCVGDGDREALLAHHEDGHALFAERVVDVVGRIAAHPGNALGLQGARAKPFAALTFMDGFLLALLIATQAILVKKHRGKLAQPLADFVLTAKRERAHDPSSLRVDAGPWPSP